MTKLENIQTYLDYTSVGDTGRYDLKIITLDGKKTYRLLTKQEVKIVYDAFYILEKRGKNNDV
jgi:hypothetical protein